MDAILIEQLPASRRSLRLAVVTETWPPESNIVARSLARLVAGLRERNHEIQLIRPKQVGNLPAAGDWDELLTGSVPLPRYPNLKLGLPAKRALIAQWTLRRPDVVHVATEGPLGWSALQAAQKLRIPLCSAFSTQLQGDGLRHGLGWLKKPIIAYLRKFHQRSMLTLVSNEPMRLELIAAGFRNLRVLPRGIDCRQFDPARRSEALRQSWGASPQTPVLLHVGSWGGEANLAPLVAAGKLVRQRRPGARLVLVGDGPQRKALRQQLPDAIFVGRLADADLATCHASADLYLHPNLIESSGSLLAAMASGLPVVAFDHPAAAPYLRHGSDGLLANLSHSDDFALRVGELIALHGHDRARFHALGRNARQRAETLDWPVLVGQLEGLLLSLF